MRSPGPSSSESMGRENDGEGDDHGDEDGPCDLACLYPCSARAHGINTELTGVPSQRKRVAAARLGRAISRAQEAA